MKIGTAPTHPRSRLVAVISALTAVFTLASLIALPSGAASVAVDEQCSPTSGFELWAWSKINLPLEDLLSSEPLHLPFTITANASPYVDPGGGVIDYSVTIHLDLQAATRQMLDGQMTPMLRQVLIDLGSTPPALDEATASSYLIMRFQQLRFVVPLPAGTTLEGSPSVSGTGGLGFTATPGPGGIEVTLVDPSGGLAAASYGVPGGGASTTTTLPPLGPQSATLHFSARTPPGLVLGDLVELNPGPLTLYLDVEPGLAYYNQLSGLAEADFGCAPTDATAVLASTVVGTEPTTTAPTAPGSSASASPSGSAAPSATSAPSTTTTASTASAAAATVVTPHYTG